MTDDIPLDHLTTEARHPDSVELDRMSARDFVALCNREDHVAVDAVGREAEAVARAIEAVAERIRRGGRLIYLGAGTSGRLGVVDASECPPTFQTPAGLVVGLIAGGERAFVRAVEGAEDDPELGAADLRALGLHADDSVVGITASGRTPYVLGGLAYARADGALTIGLSCNRDSEVARAAEIAITPVVGPELLAGSTRLKAGTATKLVLNMLSTGVMIRLGKTYGNLMVDLQASNQKLVSRSRRIVGQATGLDAAAARAALDAAGGDVKVAIVSAKRQVDADTARRLLERHGGGVRAAVEAEA